LVAGQGYTPATTTVYVRNIRIATERPTLSSAVFSRDGLSVVVSFDSDTNQAAAAAPPSKVGHAMPHCLAFFRTNERTK
jgi:hypothetical protein